MKEITERISYIPASEEPLSSDVGIVKGTHGTWIYDVAASDETANRIGQIPGRKNVVLSHFHIDHIFNLNRVKYSELYVGKNTYKYTNQGIVVDDYALFPKEDIHLFSIPSSHAKGSLGMEVDGTYAFVGDALYSTMKKGQVVYNAQLLQEQLSVLESLDSRYLLISHQPEFMYDKEKVIKKLKSIYEGWTKESPFISVTEFNLG